MMLLLRVRSCKYENISMTKEVSRIFRLFIYILKAFKNKIE